MSEKLTINVAIDGPAGAGKSTVAKRLAYELGFIYVDTGALYRAIALYMLKNEVDISDEAKVTEWLNGVRVSLAFKNDAQHVLLDDEDVTSEIRREEVGKAASVISVYPAVRKELLSIQQHLAWTDDVIMDGRDIGTCVLPDAQIKIYLTASVKTRAMRRYKELIEKGQKCDLAEIEKDIEERDYRDMHRDIAPLKVAEDAIVIDSSDMTIDEVVDKLYNLVNNYED